MESQGHELFRKYQEHTELGQVEVTEGERMIMMPLSETDTTPRRGVQMESHMLCPWCAVISYVIIDQFQGLAIWF